MPRRRRGPGRGAVRALRRLCLESLAGNMRGLWAKDYADNHLDPDGRPPPRFLVGPFDELAAPLVQELLQLMGETHKLTPAALHLLLVPHLTELSLHAGRKLVNAAVARIISARCKNLSSLDLHGCCRIPSDTLADLLKGLPCLTKLGLSGTQCNTLVLSAVGCSCRRLRELDVSHCKRLSPASLLHLAYDPTAGSLCCPLLQVLSVCGVESTGHGQDVVWALTFVLLALPGLKSLFHHLVADAVSLIHQQQFAGAPIAPGFPSLEELAQGRRASPITLPLKHLAEVGEPLLPAVSAVCPHVAEVTVLLSESPGLEHSLQAWQALTHLTLGCVGRRGLEELVPVMAVLGAQLQSLSLSAFVLEDELSFHTLLSYGSHLRTFNASLVPPVAWDCDDWQPTDEDLLCASSLRPQEFPELQAFSLNFAPPTHPSSSPKAVVLRASLVSLLKHSPELQSLGLVCLPFSLDEVFERVLEPCSAALTHLQTLSLSQSEVSTCTIHQLLSLDNPLSHLDLRGCPSIHRRHYSELLRVVTRQGLDLYISWD